MAQTNHTLLLNVMQRTGPIPARPLPLVTPQAGDSVVYRHMGEQYTGFVFAVTEYFEQAAYNVFHPLRGSVEISAGQVIGVYENARAA